MPVEQPVIRTALETATLAVHDGQGDPARSSRVVEDSLAGDLRPVRPYGALAGVRVPFPSGVRARGYLHPQPVACLEGVACRPEVYAELVDLAGHDGGGSGGAYDAG